MYAGVRKVMAAAACNGNGGVAYSLVPEEDLAQTLNSWIRVGAGESFSVWTYGTSASSTVAYKVYADISPLNESIAYNSTDATKYVTVTLTSSAIAADSTMYRYTPADLDYPFCKIRLRAVGEATNPADSLITMYLVSAK